MITRSLILGAAVLATAWSAQAQQAGTPGSMPLKNPKDGAEMVIIPAGTFTMGSDRGQGDEQPEHKVTLAAFALYKHEVTNEQYLAFCTATGHRKPANGRYTQARMPVVGVTWEDAAAYSKWAEARLPTEAEWEYAARGADGRLYPWGSQRPNGQRAKFEETNGPSTVGSFPTGASPFGCLDMAGNAWEWVADYYAYDYYQKSPVENPQGPEKGVRRVLRGGSWGYPSELRATYRAYEKPDVATLYIGFRCAAAP